MSTAPERPTEGPSTQDVENATAWSALVSSSTERVVGSAEKWRDGLAALVSLITGGLIIAGPDASDMPGVWRYAAAGSVIAGLACAGVGFVIALSVAAGRPSKQDLPAITAEYGSVNQYVVAQAAGKLRLLGCVKGLAIAGLSLLLVGAGLWMIAPKEEAAAKMTVKQGDKSYCGELKSADRGVVVLQVAGEKDPRTFELSNVTNLSVGDKC